MLHQQFGYVVGTVDYLLHLLEAPVDQRHAGPLEHLRRDTVVSFNDEEVDGRDGHIRRLIALAFNDDAITRLESLPFEDSRRFYRLCVRAGENGRRR